MHSPSPTPEHSFADFLDVDSNVPDLMSDDNSKAVEPPKNRDILDLFDAPNTDTTTTTIFSSSTITEDTTSSGTGVTLISATTQDNPFVGITEQQASPVQQADEFQETASVASEKRLSVSSTTGAVGSDTERAGVDADLAADALQSSSELFSTTEQLSTSVTESTFFSVADTTPPVVAPFSTPMRTSAAQSLFTTSEISSAQPSGPFASDLLGDFGEPTDTARSTSPTPGAEFPSSEAYKPEEQLDNLAAGKTAESGGDAFDIFASKFDKAAEQETNAGDPFLDAFGGEPTAMDTSSDGKPIFLLFINLIYHPRRAKITYYFILVWGDSSATGSETAVTGFGESDGFDSFLSMTAPPPEPSVKRTESVDSDAGPDFSVFIK